MATPLLIVLDSSECLLVCSSSHRQHRFEHTKRSQGLITHTCTIQRPGESTIILPHARNAIDRVGDTPTTSYRSEYQSYIVNCRKPKEKKNKLQPIVWLPLCIQLIVILTLCIRVRLTVCVRVCPYIHINHYRLSQGCLVHVHRLWVRNHV